jgi:hypothetical protein
MPTPPSVSNITDFFLANNKNADLEIDLEPLIIPDQPQLRLRKGWLIEKQDKNNIFFSKDIPFPF